MEMKDSKRLLQIEGGVAKSNIVFCLGAPESVRNHHGVTTAVRKDCWNEREGVWEQIDNWLLAAQITNGREKVLVVGAFDVTEYASTAKALYNLDAEAESGNLTLLTW